MSLNQQQFTTWHSQYYGRLLNSMTAIVRDRETAEDVTSMALAIAWQSMHQFREESSLYTWVYCIAVNEALRAKSKPKAASIDALEFPLAELSDSGSSSQEETSDPLKLTKALKTIPKIHRSVLHEHFILKRSVKEIAHRRRIPVGTVLSRIFTAKKRLRAAWATLT